MFQPVPPCNDPVPPSTNQYHLPLTQYHRVPTNTALYWHSTIIYQPVPFYTDPVLQSTNQYRPILTQYHQVLTSTTFYWPSIKTSLFFFSSVKNIFSFSGYYPPFPSPFIVPSAKNIFFLHIFSSFFFLVDLRWAQLYVSLDDDDDDDDYVVKASNSECFLRWPVSRSVLHKVGSLRIYGQPCIDNQKCKM